MANAKHKFLYPRRFRGYRSPRKFLCRLGSTRWPGPTATSFLELHGFVSMKSRSFLCVLYSSTGTWSRYVAHNFIIAVALFLINDHWTSSSSEGHSISRYSISNPLTQLLSNSPADLSRSWVTNYRRMVIVARSKMSFTTPSTRTWNAVALRLALPSQGTRMMAPLKGVITALYVHLSKAHPALTITIVHGLIHGRSWGSRNNHQSKEQDLCFG